MSGLSFRARVALLIVAMAIPIAGVSYFVFGHLRDAMVERAHEGARRLARNQASEMERLASSVRAVLEALARSDEVVAGDRAACGRLVARLSASEPLLMNVAVANADGEVFCSALPIDHVVNVRDEAFAQRARERRDHSIGDVRVDPITDRSVVDLAYPIVGAGGDSAGLVFASIDLPAISRSFERLDLVEGTQLYYLDRHATPFGAVGAQDLGKGVELPDAIAEAVAGASERSLVADDAEGVTRLWAVAPVTDGLGDGAIVVAIPASVAAADARSALRDDGIGLAIAIALSCVLAVLLGSRFITRDVEIMVQHTERLAGGDLSARIGARTSGPELARLGSALDAMAGKLDRLTRENRTILESAAEAICAIDRDGVIRFVNPAAADLLCCERAAAVGQRLHDLAHAAASHDADACPLLAGVSIEGKLHGVDEHFRDRRAVEYTTSILKEGEAIVGASVVLRDISAQRRLEEHLREGQKLDAVGRLAGGIAHDFNNILAVIMMAGDSLVDGIEEADPRRVDVADIVDAARRAALLTGQLLAFSRRQVLATTVLRLGDVVQEVAPMLGRLLGEDIELQTVASPDLGSVRADAGQLQQVIVNLAVNARDAMPSGGKLTIETSNVTLDEAYVAAVPGMRAGPHVLLSVSDTGTGMSDETKTRIFEPFFTTKPVGRGTGLGLATVFGIVKQSGGHIAVYSELGRGTTFRVYLPRVDAVPTEALPAPIHTAPSKNEVVLLVEDDAAARRIAHRVLAEAGYKVMEAARPSEALSLVSTHVGALDLLLTDVVMPDMNGVELARRCIAIRPSLRVLYTSGYTDRAIVDQSALGSHEDFLQKPFRAAELREKVREVLDRGGAQGVDQAPDANLGIVLLIEDDPSSARLTSLLLQRAGADVRAVGDTNEALKLLFAGLRPTVILVDVNLPGINGLDFVRVVRSLPTMRELVVVAVTASELPLGEKTALDAGCDGMIRKPIDIKTFVETVVSHVRSRSNSAQ